MNLLRNSSLQLVHQLMDRHRSHSRVRVVVCPPSVYLHDVGAALRGSEIALGAQNMHAADEGAFTGEVSGKMLVDLGCRYVILGHSERRHGMGESDAAVNEKLFAALKVGLHPIVCVGETQSERENGTTEQVISTQVQDSLANVSGEQMTKVVIAYEPVWAIGTGLTATPAQAEQVHSLIRGMLAKKFSSEVANRVCIQYGGSVKAENAKDLLSQPNIDGALVGGASLKADSFDAIVSAANQLAGKA